MKRWILGLVLGVPLVTGGLLVAFVTVTVVSGIGDPLRPVLGALEPNLRLAIWLWLGGAVLASGILLVMAWFAPWGVFFKRRQPRERFQAGEGERP